MKKLLIFLEIVVIIIIMLIVKYSSYKLEYKMIMKENEEYEIYKDKQLYGLDVASIINKAIDRNTKNEISKDENGIFIPNDTNSIEVEIYMKDTEKTYKIEQFYNMGVEYFIKYYGDIQFKCSKIEYHKNKGRIKYILLEQI